MLVNNTHTATTGGNTCAFSTYLPLTTLHLDNTPYTLHPTTPSPAVRLLHEVETIPITRQYTTALQLRTTTKREGRGAENNGIDPIP
jgi:hypothetical protein